MTKNKGNRTIPIYFESPLYEEALRSWGESRGITGVNAAVRAAIIEATQYQPLLEYAAAVEAVRAQRFQAVTKEDKPETEGVLSHD